MCIAETALPPHPPTDKVPLQVRSKGGLVWGWKLLFMSHNFE